MKNYPKYIVIHCSDVSYRKLFDQFDNINNYHRDVKEFPISDLGFYVGYHALITGNAKTQKYAIYKCKNDDEVGSHCNQGYDGINAYSPGSGIALSMNFQSLGICMGFDGDIEMPPPDMYDLLRKQVWQWQDAYKIPSEKVFFHNFFTGKAKTCPGTLITDQWLKDLLTRPLPISIDPKQNQCVDEKVVIDIQKKQIYNLQTLVQWFINNFKK